MTIPCAPFMSSQNLSPSTSNPPISPVILTQEELKKIGYSPVSTATRPSTSSNLTWWLANRLHRQERRRPHRRTTPAGQDEGHHRHLDLQIDSPPGLLSRHPRSLISTPILPSILQLTVPTKPTQISIS
ncbi:hypothetical protein LINPERHAP2_LOCUS42019 [Linum perenne]